MTAIEHGQTDFNQNNMLHAEFSLSFSIYEWIDRNIRVQSTTCTTVEEETICITNSEKFYTNTVIFLNL